MKTASSACHDGQTSLFAFSPASITKPAWIHRRAHRRRQGSGRAPRSARRLFEPPKVTHATVEYVDMPSVSRESLPIQPTWQLRVGDAFAHVLRLF